VIKAFRAKSYGCLKDVEATLTPLHAFIGPNDSGKSTLLHGMRTLVHFTHDGFQQERGGWKPFDPFILDRVDTELVCDVDGATYGLRSIDNFNVKETLTRNGEASVDYDSPIGRASYFLSSDIGNASILAQLRAARLVRFDPDALRTPSGLIPETAPVNFLDDRGLGLAGVYFALRNRDDGSFAAIVQEVRERFPTVKGIRVKAVTSSEVVLEADLTNGAKVEAKRMSEGLLYYLAFAALRHLDPVTLLLVEEPENGLHPARIVEVMRILRSISEQGTQVVMATHSPLVVNEMRADEVSIITRAEAEGTKVTLMKDTANFAKRSSVYALGELWLSFADGVAEAPLLQGRDAS